MKSHEPFVERNVRILKDRPDRDGKLLFASRALVQTFADFLLWVGSDLVNLRRLATRAVLDVLACPRLSSSSGSDLAPA